MDTAHYKSLLEDRLAELNTRLDHIESDLETPVPQDFSDQAIEREDDEVLERLGLEGQIEIEKISAALKRIENGIYGVCIECGTMISKERLELVPHTAYCKNCPT